MNSHHYRIKQFPQRHTVVYIFGKYTYTRAIYLNSFPIHIIGLWRLCGDCSPPFDSTYTSQTAREPNMLNHSIVDSPHRFCLLDLAVRGVESKAPRIFLVLYSQSFADDDNYKLQFSRR